MSLNIVMELLQLEIWIPVCKSYSRGVWIIQNQKKRDRRLGSPLNELAVTKSLKSAFELTQRKPTDVIKHLEQIFVMLDQLWRVCVLLLFISTNVGHNNQWTLRKIRKIPPMAFFSGGSSKYLNFAPRQFSRWILPAVKLVLIWMGKVRTWTTERAHARALLDCNCYCPIVEFTTTIKSSVVEQHSSVPEQIDPITIHLSCDTSVSGKAPIQLRGKEIAWLTASSIFIVSGINGARKRPHASPRSGPIFM